MLVYMRQNFMVALSVVMMTSGVYAAEAQSEQKPEQFELSFTAKSSKQRAKIKCHIAQIGNNEMHHKLINIVKYDMEFTDQFATDLVLHEKEHTPQELKKLFKSGIDTVIYVKQEAVSKKEAHDNKAKVAVKIVTTSTQKPSFDKTIVYQTDNLVAHGHRLAEEVLLALTGDKGPCVSTLAWCEKDKICYGDYAGMQVTEVTAGVGRKFGLSWHTQAPTLFFSRSTRSNNRLEMLNLKTGKQEICISYPGLSMQFVGSPDGSKGVVCLSGGKGNTELYLYDQKVCNKLGKQAFRQLTHNGGANASPCYLPNGNVVFCSDFEGGAPQLYHLDVATKVTKRLSGGSYCAAPSYCQATNSVVYTKSIDRVFQLFKLGLDDLDRARSTEQQLTFNAGDKTEPQFHENGKYVAFVYDFKNDKGHRENQIGILNCLSSNIRVITKGMAPKGYPAWTGRMLFA